MISLPRIIIEKNVMTRVPNLVTEFGTAFVIVTDKGMQQTGATLLAHMRAAKLHCNLVVLPGGEQNKNLATISQLASQLAEFKLKRDGCLIALGGGVIGDMTGFMASIFMRGIPFVMIPTTLLAMADASIGGKTGVDLSEGKNLIGTFYHPKLICMDPLLLKHLSERDFRRGMAEIIKHAMIADKSFFSLLEKSHSAIMRRDPAILTTVLRRSSSIKVNIVRRDEKESLKGAKKATSRMLLNYGHTVGHALELLSDFQLPHGEAVAIGMVAENRLAVGKKILKETDSLRLENLLTLYKLPVRIPTNFSTQQIKRAMMQDKKHIKGALHFALPTAIGHAKIVTYDI